MRCAREKRGVRSARDMQGARGVRSIRSKERGWPARALSLLLMLVSLQLGSLISPAYACGCGAMVPSRDSQVSVDRETSVVGWDGRTEQIVMRLTVRGDAPEAAWIMPVPHRASVELGDPGLFSELSVLTEPELVTRHYFWPRSHDWPFSASGNVGDGAAAPSAAAPSVEVVGRERLGPFDVARLAATDPEALEKWLRDNGFDLPDRLATALKPYVDQKWEYVAIRLAPASPAPGSSARSTRCGCASPATGWSTRCGCRSSPRRRSNSACTSSHRTGWNRAVPSAAIRRR